MTDVTVQIPPSETPAEIRQVWRILSRASVDQWPAAMLAAGRMVVAPVRVGAETPGTSAGRVEYRKLTPESPVATALGRGIPRMSPKESWFPRSEPILQITREERNISISEPDLQFPPVVVFGARPCDAAAPEILAPLFGWTSHDVFFEQRIRNVAFVVMACQHAVDEACFCTSVGIDPAGENAGDILLTELPDDRFLAQANTPAGELLLALIVPAVDPSPAEFPTGLQEKRVKVRHNIPKRFDPQRVRQALEDNFDSPIWQQWAQSCLACGTCAFTCPTCHCFDIQDEMHGNQGLRQKNWDACTFPLFTLHTSGHNPRPDQGSRWRQRLSHKFRYYPEKFEQILCTGCGRCIRNCPAGLDLLGNLMALDALAPRPLPDRVEEKLSNLPVPGIETHTPAASPNIYRPYLMKIAALRDETPDVRTLRLEFVDPAESQNFNYRVGQFGLYGAIGEGESTFCIASSPTRTGYIECTFRMAGRVTRALRRLDVGDIVGFRGPYGNSFPVEVWKGRNLLFIAGGIALPPMRSVLQYCLDNRGDYGHITVVYGANTQADHVYKDELAQWEARTDMNLWLCIDWKPNAQGSGLSDQPAAEGWTALNLNELATVNLNAAQRRYTAFVPQMVEAARPSPENCTAILCGPPVMIMFTLQTLRKLGFNNQNIYTTLENRMKCGLGKCGRCNIGPVYVCKDGPVFTAEQIEHLEHEV